MPDRWDMVIFDLYHPTMYYQRFIVLIRTCPAAAAYITLLHLAD